MDAVSMTSAYAAGKQAQNAQQVQTSVLRKSMDVQETQGQALLQMIGSLPLATQGSLGTKLNVMA